MGVRNIDVLYFSWVRERTGLARETLAVPDGIGTVAGLMDWLRERGGGYADAFASQTAVRAAVDHVHVRPDMSILTAREVAFFPPVTGG